MQMIVQRYQHTTHDRQRPVRPSRSGQSKGVVAVVVVGDMVKSGIEIR